MSVSALSEEFLFWINVRKYSLYNVFSNSQLIHRRVILSFRFAFASWVLIFYNFICFCGCLFFANNMSVSESVYKTFIETINVVVLPAACIHLEMNVASWCTLSCLQKMFCFWVECQKSARSWSWPYPDSWPQFIWVVYNFKTQLQINQIPSLTRYSLTQQKRSKICTLSWSFDIVFIIKNH